MFKTTIAAAVLLVATAAPVVANPYALKCITVEVYPPVDLTIDLDRKVMKWGSGSDKIEKFTISDVTEEYITGLSTIHDDRVNGYPIYNDDPVGGRVAYAVVPGRPICGILGSRLRHWRARGGQQWRGHEL